MSESNLNILRGNARSAPWNARGLAAHASAIAESAGMRPTNAAARAGLSARGVRFYVSHGLVDHPDGRGTAATYGYRHLVQLLAIKLLQREGKTLEQIRHELTPITGDALERRVAAALSERLTTGSTGLEQEGTAALPSLWRKVVVTSGIELHIRADSPAASDEAVRQLRDNLLRELGLADHV